jgi:hypothetical protein
VDGRDCSTGLFSLSSFMTLEMCITLHGNDRPLFKVHLISKIIAVVKSTIPFTNSSNINAIFVVKLDSIECLLFARGCQIEMTSDKMRCNASYILSRVRVTTDSVLDW